MYSTCTCICTGCICPSLSVSSDHLFQQYPNPSLLCYSDYEPIRCYPKTLVPLPYKEDGKIIHI